MKNVKTVIFGSDALESINLSEDCIKALYANHIATIDDLVMLPSTENGVINMNKKLSSSAKEIAAMVSSLTNGEGDYEVKSGDNPNFVSYFKAENKYYPNCYLASTSLLPSIVKQLRDHNLIYVSDIYGKNKEYFKSLQLAQKKVDAILNFIKEYENISRNEVKDTTYAVRFTAENVCMSGLTTDEFLEYANKVNCSGIRSYDCFLDVLYTDKNIMELSKNIVEANLEGEMFIYHLIDKLPEYLRKVRYTCHLIDLLKAEDKLYLDGCFVTKRTITLKRYLDSIPASKNKNILMMYLNGATGEEIASKYNMSKQRVFQILDKILLVKKEGVMTEEREIYGPVFTKYNFTREQFLETFNVDITLYQYLIKITGNVKKHRLPFEEILKDEDINIEYRKRANRIIYKDCVLVDGNYVKKTHFEICSFILKNYFKNGGSYATFVKYFNDILSHLSVEERESIGGISDKYWRDLAIKENVLWVSKDNFRYYDAEEHNIGSLYKAIDFSKYNNLVITSRRIFMDYQSLMKKFHIQDAYQLHDLLKKTWNKWGGKQRVDFGRNPTISFGDANLNEQLEDLLISVAPIRIDDFARLVHKEYGFHEETCKAVYFTFLDKTYRSNGKYVVSEELKNERNNRKSFEVLNSLDDDFNKYLA